MKSDYQLMIDNSLRMAHEAEEKATTYGQIYDETGHAEAWRRTAREFFNDANYYKRMIGDST